MCGRFNIIDDPMTQLIADIAGQSYSGGTRYNIAPTENIPVLLKTDTGWVLKDMRWWLVPNWVEEPATKYAMFNARSESVAKSNAFREPFKKRRCIVPVSGYYEWKKEGSHKLPLYIQPESGNGFAFAGLWDRWQKGSEVIYSCAIITAAAPQEMKAFHSRIPVHLSPGEIASWVAPNANIDDLTALLAPTIRFPLSVTPVSSRVNNARNKGDRCVEPIGDPISISKVH